MFMTFTKSKERGSSEMLDLSKDLGMFSDVHVSTYEIEHARLKALYSIANSLEHLIEVFETSDLFIQYKQKKENRKNDIDWSCGRHFD
jgi:hypothetical protein